MPPQSRNENGVAGQEFRGQCMCTGVVKFGKRRGSGAAKSTRLIGMPVGAKSSGPMYRFAISSGGNSVKGASGDHAGDIVGLVEMRGTVIALPSQMRGST